jgi:hypothetical protein
MRFGTAATTSGAMLAPFPTWTTTEAANIARTICTKNECMTENFGVTHVKSSGVEA